MSVLAAVCMVVSAEGHSPGQLLLSVGTQLQQAHEHRRHVHVGLPHREATANQINRCPTDGAVGGELLTGGLQQQERQSLT